MITYFKRLWFYHRRFLKLYCLLFIGIYGINLLHLPTPLSLLLRPLGLTSWSAGLTRASLRLLHLDFQGAWDFNPLIYPLLGLMFYHLFITPLLTKDIDIQALKQIQKQAHSHQ